MPCLDCGAPTRGATRCATHERTHRGTTTQRDYGADHQAERAAWAPIVAQGRVTCRRCDELIRPGQPWDLGHPAPKMPEHERCNRGKR